MKRMMILMCGLTHSGKSFLADEIERNIPGFNIISTRKIHDLLNYHFILKYFFKDDNSFLGKRFRIRNICSKIIQYFLVWYCMLLGHDVIVDSSNISKCSRKNFVLLKKMIPFKVRVIIIFVNTDLTTVFARLKLADDANILKGEKPAWVDLGNNQLVKFESPDRVEVDQIIEYKKTTENVIEKVKKNI